MEGGWGREGGGEQREGQRGTARAKEWGESTCVSTLF